MDHCQSVQAWYQPYVADADAEKPYGVISFLGDAPALGSAAGAFEEVRIWLYTQPGKFTGLDEMVQEVKDLLDGVLLETADSRRFRPEWVQTGRDFYDDDLRANAKDITFRIPKLR